MDPHEFTSRFFEAQKGSTDALGTNGQLLCMVIATWAASFGVNEQGEPEHSTGPHVIRARRDRTNMMVRELLQLIDLYGLLRRPSCELCPTNWSRSPDNFALLRRGRRSDTVTHHAVDRR